jgi:hypothetical protein
MAKTKLHEHILSEIPLKELPRKEAALKRFVRCSVITRIMEYDLSREDRKPLLQEVWSNDFNDLIPVIN